MALADFFKKLNEPIAVIGGLIVIVTSAYAGYDWYDSHHTPKVTGNWKFVFSIESSSMKRYVGMSAGYKIFIQEDENGGLKGQGAKWWVNDKEIPYTQHDRLEFSGSNKSMAVKANYMLYGTKATTDGYFDMKLKNDTCMEGIFAGTAADTRGKVIAIKE